MFIPPRRSLTLADEPAGGCDIDHAVESKQKLCPDELE